MSLRSDFNKLGNNQKPPSSSLFHPAPSRQSMETKSVDPMQLMEDYKPYLRIDSKEKYMPLDIDTYIEHCALMIDDVEVEPAGSLTREALLEIVNDQETYFLEKGIRGELRLQPPKDPKHPLANIIYSKANWRESAAIYGKVFEQVITEADGRKLDVYAIHYMLTYGYDDPTSVLPFFKDKYHPGWHFGDIEHIVVYVLRNPHPHCEKLVGDIVKVYFAQHGSGEGECVLGENIETGFAAPGSQRRGDKHVLVSVARGTHASYPKAGTTCRIVGLFNDVIGDTMDNQLWIPRVVPDEPFFSAKNLTYGGSNVTVEREYWKNEPTGTRYYSTGAMMRCALIGFTCLDDKYYDWIKYGNKKQGNFMRFDHEVMSSQHVPVPVALAEEKVAANDRNGLTTPLLASY
jgi:hypothetical protein